MAKPEVKPTPSKLPVTTPPVFSMERATVDDFFRMKRKGNGWVVEAVHVEGDKVAWRREIHDWDLTDITERRMRGLAMSAEFDR